MVDTWSPRFDWVILEESGQMSHVGKYVCEGSGWVTPDGIVGSGTIGSLPDGSFGTTDSRIACDTGAWADYDNDGWLDLFVLEYGINHHAPHRLYRNNGNENAWLEVKCVGTSSPRFGTGTKVRAQATIAGKAMRQLRLVDAGGTP